MRLVQRQRRNLESRQRAVQQEIGRLRERLSLIDAAARPSDFLDERARPGAYQEYRGLLGQVHADLETLSADLAQARAEWQASGSATPPPLERIVLYIDDLDRCRPHRVVEVLEAVHLMLALDLFVVVVAVDARWLIRSLEYHHRDLFRTSPDPATTPGGGDTAATATPVDYLDKIFQIPYALLTPPPAATATYLRALLPDPIPASAPPPAGHFPQAHEPEEPGDVTPAGASPDGAGTPAETTAGDHFQAPHATEGTGLADPGQPMSLPDLRPWGLRLTTAEIEFITRLGALLPTPRAAKRMVNLYRLVRISIPDAELGDFTASGPGAPYRAVQTRINE